MSTAVRSLRPAPLLVLVAAIVLAGGSAGPRGVAAATERLPTDERPRVLIDLPDRSTGRAADDIAHVARVAADWTGRSTPDVPEPAVRSMSRAAAGASGAGLEGRNHLWIPALGIDRSVSGFACSSSAYPGDRVYRWGCAGARNVYLFGHAHSVFKPLHDAYVRGRLARGMELHYADGLGTVHTYAVRWWRVTTPEDGEWAYAGQSTPSLTLQTCVGADSEFRLIVRLTRVD